MLDALSGAEVTHIPTGRDFRARFTHPYIIIHREDIHRVLIDACAAVPSIAMEGGAEGLLPKPIDFAWLRTEIEMRVEKAA